MKKTLQFIAFLLLPVATIAGLNNPEFARLVAHEGTVLLKNNRQTLPLKQGAPVALFGINSIDYVRGGGGSGIVGTDYVNNLLLGLQEKQKEGKIIMFSELVDFYQTAFANGSRNANEPKIPQTLMVEAVKFAKTAIITLGRYSEEGTDRKAEKGDFYLSESEQILINQVLTAKFERVIVTLNIGGVIDTRWFKNDNRIDAVVLGWQAGMEGGSALADILVGDAYPSGKLTSTFAKTYTDYPSSSTFNESNIFVNYEEDIFVGYRYFETIPGAATKVNYEFGFGLGYTSFSITNTSARQEGDDIVVLATVNNTGNRKGKEVVQVYYGAPKGVLTKPAKELAAFAKTKELAPGESQTLQIRFPINSMASYDDEGKLFPAAYVLEKGRYTFHVGNSVRNTRALAYRYEVKENRITEQLTHHLVPNMLPRRMLANGSFKTLPVDMRIVKQDIPVLPKKILTTTHPAPILLKDVHRNPELMPQFLAQLSDEDLIAMSTARPNGVFSNLGGMGFLPHQGIPNLLPADGPAGLRTAMTATNWPCGTQQACTWNMELLEEVGKRIADEAIKAGIGIWLAPGMNIHRDPLCGRNFEYYSEDPVLAGKVAAAVTRGVQSKKVAVTLKHFAANNKEYNRKDSDSRISERALREIYLRAFEIAIKEADAWAIMSSYNMINGIHASENYDLLTRILREEWGFNGFVMTDWNNHAWAVTEAKAGNDIKMERGQPHELRAALKNGMLLRSELERNIERLLNVMMRTHTFEDYINGETGLRQAGGIPVPTCTDSRPNWGSSLGTVSFASNQTWQIGEQIWSDAVQATGCQKTSFFGGSSGAYRADCRSNPGFPGDLFSWCAVVQYANVLCPVPWRIPVAGDFQVLVDNINKLNAHLTGIHWGAGRSGGYSGDGVFYRQGRSSYYWSATESSAINGRFLNVGEIGGTVPQAASIKSDGFALRCIK